VDQIHDDIGSLIQEDDVPAHQNVSAFWRGWRQLALKFSWARLDALLKTRWQRAASNELFFQSWR
jgi:hypothetical protein